MQYRHSLGRVRAGPVRRDVIQLSAIMCVPPGTSFYPAGYEERQMAVTPEHDATIIAEDHIDYQLRFADRALRNAQDLVRFLDQKAGLTITAVSILTAALARLCTFPTE